MQECIKGATSCATETGKSPARFTKVAVCVESSDDEFGILEDERRIHNGVFQNRATFCTSWCLLAAIPRRGHTSVSPS